jgi:hypothetical protein
VLTLFEINKVTASELRYADIPYLFMYRVKIDTYYRMPINYRRISLRLCRLHTVNVTFSQGQCLRPTTSKDTTRIAKAHQHRNRERLTRQA